MKNVDIISKKEISSKKKKFFSIIVLAILLAVANVCTYGQKLVRDVGSNGLWGYIEKPSRELKISYKFSEAKQFSEGLAAVQEGLVYKWGFIDKTGKIVIPYKYERVRNFSEGVAVVRLHNKWGAIDTKGTEIVPCIYDTRNEASIAISNPKAAEEFERKLALERERLDAQEREVALERERLDAQEREKIALERERIAAQTINPIATNAYDIILLRNGNEIKAKVTEITLSEIKYKAFEYLEGPTRVVEKSDVFLIIYENGTREVFNTTTETKTSNTKNRVVTESKSLPNKPGQVSIGLNPVISFPANILLTNFGFYGKLRVGVANSIRLEGSFAYYLPRTVSVWTNIDMKFNMWEVDLNVHPTFKHFSKDDKFLFYPLIGLGISGLKATVLINKIPIDDESLSVLFFGMNVGIGFDVKLYKKLYFNTEVKYWIIFSKKATLYSAVETGGRTMISAGLSLKF